MRDICIVFEYANSEGSVEPAHPHCLVRAFVASINKVLDVDEGSD